MNNTEYLFEFSASVKIAGLQENFKEGQVRVKSYTQEMAEQKAELKVREELMREYGPVTIKVTIKTISDKWKNLNK